MEMTKTREERRALIRRIASSEKPEDNTTGGILDEF